LHNCKVTALYLLDLSAGFDTINHTIITVRLSLCYGVSSVAEAGLNLVSEIDRHQWVNIGKRFSSPHNISCDFP